MKIVFGTDVFHPYILAGGEMHIYNVAKKLIEFGNEVTVICGKTSHFLEDPFYKLKNLKNMDVVDDINIIRTKIPYKYGSTFTSFPALYEMYSVLNKMIKKKKVDIVNLNMYRPCIPLYMAAKNKIPVTLTVHYISESFGTWSGWKNYEGGIIGGFAQKIIENIILSLPYDRILTVSKCMQDLLIKKYTYNKNYINLIYNGIDLEKYNNIDANNKIGNKIIFIGELSQRKNILDVIKAAEIVKKKIKDLKLIIISGGGILEPILYKHIKKKSYIYYYKRISEDIKIKLLKESDLLIIPSSFETFGLVTIEALACYTPFLAYDIPVMKEINKETKGGILVKYKDYKSLSKKIFDLLNNRSKIIKLGGVGYKNVEKKFTWKIVSKKVENIFKNIINNYKQNSDRK